VRPLGPAGGGPRRAAAPPGACRDERAAGREGAPVRSHDDRAGGEPSGPLIRLGELPPGSRGKIGRLSCGRKLRRRLMDMGVVSGTPFEIERVAPLGDPIELKLKDCHISLRRDEAGGIWVETDHGQ
jgi:ferrous iron transport protein A